jgi:hypothetical protein
LFCDFRARGLGSLIKARNIHTIGDLSSLTEKQVDELPIRSPKVSVVRKVLKKYGEQTNSKQSKNGSMETNMKQDEGNFRKQYLYYNDFYYFFPRWRDVDILFYSQIRNSSNDKVFPEQNLFLFFVSSYFLGLGVRSIMF